MSGNDDYDAVYFDIAEFLAEYEQLPELWDVRHKSFKDWQKKCKLKEVLGIKLGITDTNTLRRKIRSVRGTYNTEIRKIKQSLERGEAVYFPRLFWFPLADRFLRATTDLSFEEFPLMTYREDITPKKKLLQKLPKVKGIQIIKMHRSGNNETSEQVNHAAEQYEEFEFLEDDSCMIKFEQQTNESDIEELEEIVTDETELSDSGSHHRPRKRHKSDLDDTAKQRDSSENEFLMFGRSIGIQLQSMPLKIAIQLQMDIQAHVSKARLEYLKRTRSENNDEC